MRRIPLKADGSEQILPAKCDGIEVQKGDLLYFNTWGGGGWGDPFKRPVEQVASDVAQGLVTESGAKRYGVGMANGSVDAAATESLREYLTAQRGEPGLLDFGGTIADLKERCKAETGLAAPSEPVFRKARA